MTLIYQSSELTQVTRVLLLSFSSFEVKKSQSKPSSWKSSQLSTWAEQLSYLISYDSVSNNMGAQM